MKKNNLSYLLLGGITIAAIACNSKTEGLSATVSVDKDQIRQEIQAKEDSFANLYNTNQVRNIGYYADDAISFFQNRPPLVGRDSIVAFLKDEIVNNTSKITFGTREVFVSNDGNQVVEVGSFQVVDSVNTPINRGNYMTLFEKRNGKYVAVRDMSASDGTVEP